MLTMSYFNCSGVSQGYTICNNFVDYRRLQCIIHTSETCGKQNHLFLPKFEILSQDINEAALFRFKNLFY
jgi:hypothetical protein